MDKYKDVDWNEINGDARGRMVLGERADETRGFYTDDDLRDKALFAARVGEPLHLEDIDNTLEAMQEFVGGYIETVTLEDGRVIVCNEEGVILGLPNNHGIAGNFFICEVNGDEFASVGFREIIRNGLA